MLLHAGTLARLEQQEPLNDVACWRWLQVSLGFLLPTLVVWGRNDEILSPDYAQRFMDVLPDARLAWIEECGHCSHLEQPAALLAAISDFCGLAAQEPEAAAAAAAL